VTVTRREAWIALEQLPPEDAEDVKDTVYVWEDKDDVLGSQDVEEFASEDKIMCNNWLAGAMWRAGVMSVRDWALLTRTTVQRSQQRGRSIKTFANRCITFDTFVRRCRHSV